jgi:hypothetical protein
MLVCLLLLPCQCLTNARKVEETPQKQCCGAIDQHLSANDEALQKIKKNIDAWHSFEVIISSRLSSIAALPISNKCPYSTPDGQVVSQARQVRQRSKCCRLSADDSFGLALSQIGFENSELDIFKKKISQFNFYIMKELLML